MGPEREADGTYAGLVAIIPALDEAGSIGEVVSRLKQLGVPNVIVADNGSTDATADIARRSGATVVAAARRGYGSACMAGLAALPKDTRVVVFCDGDGADDLALLPTIVGPILDGRADLVIGSRALGAAEPDALTLPQRAGNWVAVHLMRLLFSHAVSDLGPFRAVSSAALARLHMSDPAFGWTAEMQTKALRLRMRVVEVPVNARVRRAGASKISGRAGPVVRAGWAILTTIVWYRVAPIGPSRSREAT